MFVELMPLLAGRTVLITVAKVDDKTLRVNVFPHGKADDNPALSTPLTCTGSPEELDAELGKHLACYVQTHKLDYSINWAELDKLYRSLRRYENKQKRARGQDPNTTVIPF